MESAHRSSVVAARGYSLVELIVVLFIIIVITTITITSHATYNRSLILTNTAYTVALSIREAQSLGLSSRKFDNVQNAGYGVFFQDVTPASYNVFADISKTFEYGGCPTGEEDTPEFKPGNCLFDSTTEILSTFTLNKGFKVHTFCGVRSATISDKVVCGTDADWGTLHITFLRPNTEAIMTMKAPTGNDVADLNCAIVWIEPPAGAADRLKCITISKVGQVAVPQTCESVETYNARTTCP